MDIHRVLVIFAFLALMTPTISSATEFVVGDNDGWKTGVNYTEWAKGKQFFVGDTLVFKYKAEDHNVFKVDGSGFNSCTVPTDNNLGYFSGNDAIKLAAVGNKWYICGKTGHCSQGQKLKITVLDAAPAYSTASTLLVTNFQILLGMIFSIAAIVNIVN